ncbi:MAG: ABC transporter ATP-binding protein [bacterium]
MTESADTVIRLQELTKVYHGGGGDVVAVDHLSLSIPSGVTVLAGPSGCGKSTLVNLLGALDHPTSGIVEVAGHILSELNEDQIDHFRRKTVGIVFQFFHLMPVLTVLENVALPAELAGTSPSLARQRAAALLERVGLAHRAGHQPHELSGGEIQRTAIARALVNNPAVVLADEPTGNLDSAASRRVMELFAEAVTGEGASAVVATHDPDVVARADRVFHLLDGRLERIEENAAGVQP